MAWPAQLWQDVMAASDGEQQCERMRAHSRRGFLCTTAFSGMDAARYAFLTALHAWDVFDSSNTSVAFVQACDIAQKQLELLMSYSVTLDAGASCVHNNIEGRLSASTVEVLEKLMPPPGASTRQRRVAFRSMHSALLRDATRVHPRDAVAECLVHGKPCRVCPRAALRDSAASGVLGGTVWHEQLQYQQRFKHSWHIHFGSTVCSGHSALGTRQGLAHASEFSHAVWVSERLARTALGEEDIFFHENRPEYPVDVQLRQALSSTHTVYSVVTSPKRQGRPINRTRRLTCGVSKRMRYVGPPDVQKGVDDFCNRTLRVGGDIFMTASNSELMEMYREIGAKRHVSTRT